MYATLSCHTDKDTRFREPQNPSICFVCGTNGRCAGFTAVCRCSVRLPCGAPSIISPLLSSWARMRHCSHAGCKKQLAFNIEGRKMAAYCKTHAEVGTVGAKQKRCSHDSCTRRPSFNIGGSNTAAYCRKHAEGQHGKRSRQVLLT